MTNEEEIEFTNKIIETIIPHVINMTQEQIKNIIRNVEIENKNLPTGFGNMLYEQIIIHKYNNHTNIN